MVPKTLFSFIAVIMCGLISDSRVNAQDVLTILKVRGLTVSANSAGIDTGINVVAGDTLEFEVKGGKGRLVGSVDGNTPFPVTNESSHTSQKSGYLNLRAIDLVALTGSETGVDAFQVTITLTRNSRIFATALDSATAWGRGLVKIKPGDDLMVHANASITYQEGSSPVGANGNKVTNGSLLAPGFNMGSVIAKIGQGVPIKVGEDYSQKKIDQSGLLYLTINDDIKQPGAFDDNTGNLTLIVEVDRAVEAAADPVKVSGRETRKPLTIAGHSDTVFSVAFSPDGKTIASGSFDKTVRLWDAASGKELMTHEFGPSQRITSVAFSPDGKTFAGGGWTGKIRLLDVASGEELRELDHGSPLNLQVAFSPDGKTAVSSGSPSIKVWDVASGELRKTLKGGPMSVSVAISPDGKTFVTDYGPTVILWNLTTGEKLKELTGHTARINSVAFSPDGKTIASGSADFSIKLWDAATGELRKSLAGHTWHVWSVAFSPDGKTIASGGDDKTIKLWDAANGKEIKSIAETAGVRSVAFSPDGRTIAGGVGNTIKLWPVQ